MDQMASFHQRLEAVQKQRSDEAAKLHSDIKEVQGALSHDMQRTVGVIQQMKKETDQAYSSMAEQQKAFDQELLQATKDSSARDKSLLDKMSQRMDELDNE